MFHALRHALLAVLISFFLSGSAYASQCVVQAPPEHIPAARLIALNSDATVDVTFCGGEAGYTSEVHLSSPRQQHLGTGHYTSPDTRFQLGAFQAGSELIFSIYVRNTGFTYYTGPGSRNPDGLVHAAVTDLGNGTYHVGFEDVYSVGDADYDDINIIVTSQALQVEPPEPTEPEGWVATSPLARERILHTANLLPDGQVLVAGGYNRTTEVYDPATRTWARHGDTRTTHRYHTATSLQDGRVLVAGGDGASASASAELYDPATRTWSATANLLTYRRHHAAVRLKDGRVLVMGGLSSSGQALVSAELYDPTTGSWSATGSLHEARSDFTATLLENGSVLVAGGNKGGRIASAEVYYPTLGVWTTAGNMTQGRSFHTATLMNDGRVLVTGGAQNGAAATAELYDPYTRTWFGVPSMNQPRRHHTATLMNDGRVLVVGGYDDLTGIHTSAEVYDRATETWTPTASMSVDRSAHTATLMNDGHVLVVTGVSNTSQSSAEVF